MRHTRRTSKPRNHRPAARFLAAAGLGLVSLVLLPALASAQSIGGTVTDTTGGVLPGVTVEARSPALIEQVRTAITDGNGQFQIVALETGTYSVTFTLPGFSTLVREGVELSTGFTANVDVRLAVGALEETVTVTEASPLIDVQNMEQRETIDREIYESLPTSRTYDAMALLIPAMNVQGGPTTTISVDTSGISGKGNNRLSIHGSDEEDSEMQLDGLDSNLVAFDGAPEGTPFDTAIAEYVYDYSGNSAEVETGGVRLNMIPKEGSNTFSGGFYGDVVPSAWLANNINQRLLDLGIVGGEEGGVKLDQSWYVGPSFGGPIVRDHLWFFTSYSNRRSSLSPANLFNSQDTSALTYVPDLDNPTIDRQDNYEATIRLTWQATSRDKVQAYWSNNYRIQIPSLSGSQLDPIYIAPEAGSENEGAINTYQITWVRPHTNRILFEFGAALQPVHYILYPLDSETARLHGTGRHDLNARTDLPGVFEGSDLTMSRNMGFFFGGTDVWYSTSNTTLRGSMSYVTGSHNLKFGFTSNQKWQNESYRSGNNWTNMITFFGSPVSALFSARPNETNQLTNIGIYAQEQWTVDRLTVNAGVRMDYFRGFYPDQTTEAMTWAPTPRSFPGMTVASWKDLQPRLGIVYDLRGDGRTALKASASRYGDRNAIALAGLINPVANNILMSRSWFDGGNPFGLPGVPSCIPSAADPTGSSCIAGDGLVQGNPLNDAPNGELLDPNPTPGFATPAITEFFDPDYAFGWGKKGANWEFSGSVQHQLADGVSVDVGYFRRGFVNLTATDNRATSADDWDEYTITVPQDPRLPDGGGFPLTLVDLNPAAIAIPDNLTTSANQFGGMSRMWQGVDLNFSAQLEGILFQGGYATGRETQDSCAVQGALPETVNEGAGGLTGGGDTVVPLEFCSSETPWISQVSMFGSYTFPYDIEVSGAFFSRQGTERLAVIQVPVADATALLGRAPTETSIFVNVARPGSLWGDRLNQVDLRLAKVLNLGGSSTLRASLDIHNLLNGNSVSRERYTLANYLQPLGLQPGRMAKLSFQYNF